MRATSYQEMSLVYVKKKDKMADRAAIPASMWLIFAGRGWVISVFWRTDLEVSLE